MPMHTEIAYCVKKFAYNNNNYFFIFLCDFQRWDVYLSANTPNEKVHWFSISNSFMIVLFLTVMVAMILLRALRKVLVLVLATVVG